MAGSGIIQKLTELKDQLDTAQAESTKAEAQLEVLLDRLKDEFGCKDLDSAIAKLEDLRKACAKDEADLAKDVTALDTKMKKALAHD